MELSATRPDTLYRITGRTHTGEIVRSTDSWIAFGGYVRVRPLQGGYTLQVHHRSLEPVQDFSVLAVGPL